MSSPRNPNARKTNQQHPVGNKPNTRWGLIIGAITAMIVIAGCLILWWGKMASETIAKTQLQMKSAQARSLMNVLSAYAVDHDMVCPKTLDALIDGGMMDKFQLAKILSDPENPSGGGDYFEYFGNGKKLDFDSKEVLLKSKPHSKTGKRVIVPMNGSARIE